jgi:peroxiredoxin
VASRRHVVVIAAAVAAAVLAALLLSEPVPDPIRAGQPAPDFQLPRLSDGSPVSLGALRGRVVLVNFWATWCAPCLEEMPAMERLYQELRGEGFELVAVSVDAGRDEVQAFRDRLDLSFPILLDPERAVAHAYQSYRYPESYLIDPSGRIAARYIGPRDWDAEVYARSIRRLLPGKPTS